MTRVGISPMISYVLYVGVGIAVVAIVATMGVPTITQMQETASVDSMQTEMRSLASMIDAVATDGRNAQRSMTLQIDRGSVRFENESLIYELRTGAQLVTPGTSDQSGQVTFSANSDVELVKTQHNGVPCYRLSNDHIETCIRSYDAFTDARVSEMMLYLDGDGMQRATAPGLNVSIDDDPGYHSGKIRTVAEQRGTTMTDGTVNIQVKPPDRPSYTIAVTLRSGADFFLIEIE